MSSVEPLWVRSFTRNANPDIDTIASPPILNLLSVDFFGRFLQQGTNLNLNSFDELVMLFWNGSKKTPQENTIATYCVADGSYIKLPPSFGPWFNPHIRFLTVVTPCTPKGPQVFIVGSNELTSTTRFLQVASWDTKVFHFYGKTSVNGDPSHTAWIYHGNSSDGFGANEYLGPFNGHVNGACIMKELHEPWYHWYSGKNTEISRCFSDTDRALFMKTPYLTAPGCPLFRCASVGFANDLEDLIEPTVTNWYQNRLFNDLSNGGVPKPEPSNIPRWMAHFLLTTTVNIATSGYNGDKYTAPLDHFIDNELLSKYGELLPYMGQFDFTFDDEIYKEARNALNLSLLQEVDPDDVKDLPKELSHVTLKPGTLGGGKQTDEHETIVFLVTAPRTEGVPFVILQSSYEDAQGVFSAQNIDLGSSFPQSLLSDKAFQAITMIDFWNPIYSWRRGILWQYVPSQTALKGDEYDCEANFVASIRNSTYSKVADSPEYQFLSIYDENDPISKHQARIESYLTAASNRLNTALGMTDYLTLAESRRRLYRPLPLDEFGFSLPYALGIPLDAKPIEMTEAGMTQPIPARGIEFLQSWLGTLWTDDPKLLPKYQDSTFSMNGTSSLNGASSLNGSSMALGSASSLPRRLRNSRCPAMNSQRANSYPNQNSNIASSPTWEDNVKRLFSAPYWLANAAKVGSIWIGQMCSWSPPTPQPLHLDLADCSSVKYNAVTIYQHLRSKSMPITSDPNEYWPDDALETFRLWANQGFRNTANDPIVSKQIIPPPTDPPATLRVRKDLLSLTAEELQTYRAKLDDILEVGKLGSKWQELGTLHAEWCLHYQEATFFWHRAYLRYVEELLDFPIPYWDGFAEDTSDPKSPHAGLPAVFLDEYYTHPSGEQRLNPLKNALAWNGKNKLGTSKYVQRSQVLVEGPNNPGWNAKISLFKKYHQQIQLALSQPDYSIAQGRLPWANLPAFSEDQPDDDYPLFAKTAFFDGHFEQAHDNFHGWVGPDMADNTYTGFDPVFLSYHANMDRLVDMYLKAKPNQSLASNTPLQPFINCGQSLSYSDPRTYLYTTVGDMSKDTKALQYMYSPPATRDYSTVPRSWAGVQPTGGSSVSIMTKQEALKAKKMVTSKTSNSVSLLPYVIFSNVACTTDTFRIDIFVKGAASKVPDPSRNQDYIGQVTCLGMGPGQGNTAKSGSRCDKPSVTRSLDAECVKEKLKKVKGIEQIVTDLVSGRVVNESIWSGWSGFKGELMWSC